MKTNSSSSHTDNFKNAVRRVSATIVPRGHFSKGCPQAFAEDKSLEQPVYLATDSLWNGQTGTPFRRAARSIRVEKPDGQFSNRKRC